MSKGPDGPVKPEGEQPPAAQGEGMSRRQFIIRLSAYGVTAAAASTLLARGVARAQEIPPDDNLPLGGTIEATAEIDGGEGASSYYLVGSLVYETYENPNLKEGDWGMRILTFSLQGKRMSGPELGAVTLSLAEKTDGISYADGSYVVGGPLVYTDEVHGRLIADTKWLGTMDFETDELKDMRLEAVARDADGKMALPMIGVGVGIPIGKMTDDDEEM